MHYELVTKASMVALWLQTQLLSCNSIGSEKALFAFVLHFRWKFAVLMGQKYRCKKNIDYEADLFHPDTKRRRFDKYETWKHLFIAQELYISLKRFCTEISSTYLKATSIPHNSKSVGKILSKKNVYNMFYESVTNAQVALFMRDYNDEICSFLTKYLLVFFSNKYVSRLDGRRSLLLCEGKVQ
jgi:hypothetical protein